MSFGDAFGRYLETSQAWVDFIRLSERVIVFVALRTSNVHRGHSASRVDISRMSWVPRIRISGIHLTRITRHVITSALQQVFLSSFIFFVSILRSCSLACHLVHVCMRVLARCMCVRDWHYPSIRSTSLAIDIGLQNGHWLRACARVLLLRVTIASCHNLWLSGNQWCQLVVLLLQNVNNRFNQLCISWHLRKLC